MDKKVTYKPTESDTTDVKGFKRLLLHLRKIRKLEIKIFYAEQN
jgi:hypothetical protein